MLMDAKVGQRTSRLALEPIGQHRPRNKDPGWRGHHTRCHIEVCSVVESLPCTPRFTISRSRQPATKISLSSALDLIRRSTAIDLTIDPLCYPFLPFGVSSLPSARRFDSRRHFVEPGSQVPASFSSLDRRLPNHNKAVSVTF